MLLTNKARRVPFFAALLALLAACAGDFVQRPTALATVTLERRLYLTAPDGSDVEFQPGAYQVANAGESRLRVARSGGNAAVLVQAARTTHEEAVESPVALTVAGEDVTHVVLLMPDRTALAAAGSSSGVRSRAAPPPQLSTLQIRQVYGSQILGSGAARRLAVPVATIQRDLNIFATPVMDLPSPIAMKPAPGSYQASCVGISQVQTIRVNSPWTITTLTAQCRNGAGVLVPARLNDPQTCGPDIANLNGVLECNRPLITALGRVMFPLPAGSWQQTCRDAYHHLQSREVRAQCRTVSGDWRYTSLSTAYACASVSNDNGWMSCDSAQLPRGPWRGYCKEASIPLADVGFAAICMRPSDRVWQRTTVGPCTKEVDALDGHLACGLITGVPSGNWVGRCRPVNWDSAEPAITLVCRNNDKSEAAYRVNISNCPDPRVLHYDGSGVGGFFCGT